MKREVPLAKRIASQNPDASHFTNDASRDTLVSSRGLRLRDDVGVRFFDAVDGMDFRNHHVGECSLVLNADENKNIRYRSVLLADINQL